MTASSQPVLSQNEVFASAKAQYELKNPRNFAMGLLIAFIDLMLHLKSPTYKFKSAEDFYKIFPRVLTTKGGGVANTLILNIAGETKSLRFFYDKVETLIITTNKRYGYPSMAPHATQAWGDYPHWINALCTFDTAQLKKLREDALAWILEKFASHDVNPKDIRKDPPVFFLFIGGFELKAGKREASGSPYQGCVFAYIRADSPHLQVEVRKTRTGSKRVGGIGDIDAWDGSNLIITCEVKQFKISVKDVPGFEAFIATGLKHRADVYVIGLEFEEGAEKLLQGLGAKTLSKANLLDRISHWDPLKQVIAMRAFEFFSARIERSDALTKRFKAFCETNKFETLTRAWTSELKLAATTAKADASVEKTDKVSEKIKKQT